MIVQRVVCLVIVGCMLRDAEGSAAEVAANAMKVIYVRLVSEGREEGTFCHEKTNDLASHVEGFAGKSGRELTKEFEEYFGKSAAESNLLRLLARYKTFETQYLKEQRCVAKKALICVSSKCLRCPEAKALGTAYSVPCGSIEKLARKEGFMHTCPVSTNLGSGLSTRPSLLILSIQPNNFLFNVTVR